MHKVIDLTTWKRREHFEFFSTFEEPFFGVTAHIECTHALRKSRQEKTSFFLLHLYRALKAANAIEAFRLRIDEAGRVVLFDEIHASPTIGRDDHSFGFSYMDFSDSEAAFIANAEEVVKSIKQTSGLGKPNSKLNVIHFSSLPWIRFTSVSHARMFSFRDSIPKISFGQYFEEGEKVLLPVSVHAHHGLADGYHVGLFFQAFEKYMAD